MTDPKTAARLALFDEIGDDLKAELRAIPDSVPGLTDEERERLRDEIEERIARTERRLETARAKIASGVSPNAPNH